MKSMKLHYVFELIFGFVLYLLFGFQIALLYYVISIEVNTMRIAKGWK